MRMKFLSIMLSLMFVVVSFTTVVAAEGTTHYLFEGDDLQQAIDDANPGDTIILGPGTFDVGDILYVNKSLTLRGSGAEHTTLFGAIYFGPKQDRDAEVSMGKIQTVADMAIVTECMYAPGISTSLWTADAPAPESQQDAGCYTFSSITITDCIIRAIGGINVQYAESILIARNFLVASYDVVMPAPDDADMPPDALDGANPNIHHGIYAGSSREVDIRGNMVFDFDWVGIASPYCDTVRITNNIVLNSLFAGIGSTSDNVMVANNTLVTNGNGIRVSAETAAVVNNIILDSYIFMFDAWIDADTIVFANNDIYHSYTLEKTPGLEGTPSWGFPEGYEIWLDGCKYFVSGNIFEDPLIQLYVLFAAPAGGRDGVIAPIEEESWYFSLLSTSPCRDAGVDASVPEFGGVHDDIIGTHRPQGGLYDIGAVEMVASYTPATMQPLVRTSLVATTHLWNDILLLLPEAVTPEQQALLDEIQSLIAGAGSLGNPIAANGALQQAMALMESLQATLA